MPTTSFHLLSFKVTFANEEQEIGGIVTRLPPHRGLQDSPFIEASFARFIGTKARANGKQGPMVVSHVLPISVTTSSQLALLIKISDHIHNTQPSTLSSWSHWPRGPVDLKSYWPPVKSTGPHFSPTDVNIRD